MPTEPTEAQRAQHNLTHCPYAVWCELCAAHHARQDGHEPQPHVMLSQATVVSHVILAMLHEMTNKINFVLFFLHDRHTGAMHAVPTPQKGGRWLNHLCTEFCRFILWPGHHTISLKCD